ncbi:MAG: hypothetical protein ACXWLB_07660 [Reyranella sp.]
MDTMLAAAPSLRVMGEEEAIEIGFPALAAFHGQSALAMLAITFQGLRGAFDILSPAVPPPRAEIAVVSGHPGPGVRDAFEFVTRASTRGAYIIDRSLPKARLNPRAGISYSFRLSLRGRTVEAALRPGVLPERFFELFGLAADDAVAAVELSDLKRAIAARVLQSTMESLFDFA